MDLERKEVERRLHEAIVEQDWLTAYQMSLEQMRLSDRSDDEPKGR